MCGGFVAAAAGRDAGAERRAVAPLLPALTLARRQLAYHAGRVTCYALLGAGFGAAGAATLNTAALLPLQRTLYIGANVFLILMGLSLVLRAPGITWLQRAGGRFFAAVLPA